MGRTFEMNALVENAQRRSGRIQTWFPVEGKARVRWTDGSSSLEDTDNLRLVPEDA